MIASEEGNVLIEIVSSYRQEKDANLKCAGSTVAEKNVE
jgi:hypothetical protein